VHARVVFYALGIQGFAGWNEAVAVDTSRANRKILVFRSFEVGQVIKTHTHILLYMWLSWLPTPATS